MFCARVFPELSSTAARAGEGGHLLTPLLPHNVTDCDGMLERTLADLSCYWTVAYSMETRPGERRAFWPQ